MTTQQQPEAIQDQLISEFGQRYIAEEADYVILFLNDAKALAAHMLSRRCSARISAFGRRGALVAEASAVALRARCLAAK